MSHREEFEKALREMEKSWHLAGGWELSDPNEARWNKAVADIRRLYDEKPPTRSDLEAVARMAIVAASGISLGTFDAKKAQAAEVVTRYLEGNGGRADDVLQDVQDSHSSRRAPAGGDPK